MREFDLFSSIGELDEKLLRRYGQEPTPTPQRRAWLRQLLTHGLLLLLVLGLIAGLYLIHGSAENELDLIRYALDHANNTYASAQQAEDFYALLQEGIKLAPEGCSFGTVEKAEVVSADDLWKDSYVKRNPHFSLALEDGSGNRAVLTILTPDAARGAEIKRWIRINGILILFP